ncbi:MAG: hypothetical protein V9G14_12975 [Cypionkella sp.]
MIAALSRSIWRRRASPDRAGIRRGTSWRMIAGIIWKVEALPTPVRKKSAMKQAKKPAEAAANSGLPARRRSRPATAAIMPSKDPEGDPPAAEAVC